MFCPCFAMLCCYGDVVDPGRSYCSLVTLCWRLLHTLTPLMTPLVATSTFCMLDRQLLLSHGFSTAYDGLKKIFWLWSSLLVVASPLLLLLVPCYQLCWWSLLSTITYVSVYLFSLLHICVSTDFFLTCCDVGWYKYFNLSYYSISAIWWHCYCFLCYFIRSFWCPCCSDITSMTECVSSGSFRQVILQLIHPLSVWILYCLSSQALDIRFRSLISHDRY